MRRPIIRFAPLRLRRVWPTSKESRQEASFSHPLQHRTPYIAPIQSKLNDALENGRFWGSRQKKDGYVCMSLALAGESSSRFDVGQEAELCAPLPPRPAPGGAPPLHEITSCRYRMRIATRRILHMRQEWMPISSLTVSSEFRHNLLRARWVGTSTASGEGGGSDPPAPPHEDAPRPRPRSSHSTSPPYPSPSYPDAPAQSLSHRMPAPPSSHSAAPE
ncbi:hypothetical protein DFH08DRAFT_1085753 [Mycena albidolilacea]|uniref:Uncharacterized protein n=1 Tax=Mycena albidolilacea TaxID=1033008 RepID=A0AAD6ZHT4_9AGAR|nr:hypothetical protein DFH08DRAFT_1085753 [Mycena albidolilacea]